MLKTLSVIYTSLLVHLEVEEFVGVEIPERESEVEVEVGEGNVGEVGEVEVEVAEVVAEVGEECPICLDEFDEEKKCFVTNCGHKFHEKCLVGWLSERDTCPSCRRVLVK
jgi:hypothetical protein